MSEVRLSSTSPLSFRITESESEDGDIEDNMETGERSEYGSEGEWTDEKTRHAVHEDIIDTLYSDNETSGKTKISNIDIRYPYMGDYSITGTGGNPYIGSDVDGHDCEQMACTTLFLFIINTLLFYGLLNGTSILYTENCYKLYITLAWVAGGFALMMVLVPVFWEKKKFLRSIAIFLVILDTIFTVMTYPLFSSKNKCRAIIENESEFYGSLLVYYSIFTLSFITFLMTGCIKLIKYCY